MTVTVLSYVLWALSVVGHVSVFAVLTARRLSHTRVLKIYMAFEAIHSAALFLFLRYGDHKEYAVAYSVAGVLSYAFQLTILYELTRSVTRPLGHVFRTSRIMVYVILGSVALGAFSFFTSAHLDQSSVLTVWENRVSVFVSGMICAVIIIVFWVMNSFYLTLRRHARAIAQGLFFWHYSLLCQDGIHVALWTPWYPYVDYGVEIVYLAVLGYWITLFWKGEELPPALPAETLASMRAFCAAIERGNGLEESN